MGKVVNLDTHRANVRSQRTTLVSEGPTKIVRRAVPPKRVNVENPLSKEQRESLNGLIKDWIDTRDRMRNPIKYGKAWKDLFDKCLLGKVAHLNEIEGSEFAECKLWIQQQIRIAESGNPSLARKAPDYIRSKQKYILARCGALEWTESERHKYCFDRFGVQSLNGLSYSQTEEFAQHMAGNNPSRMFKERVNATEHELRVKALTAWLADKEREDYSFDRSKIQMTKSDMLASLQKTERTLFPISDSYFDDFLKKCPRGLYSFRRGRPPKTSG